MHDKMLLVDDEIGIVGGRNYENRYYDWDGEFDYRTKITLAVSDDGRRIGLHPYDRPDRIFDLHWCHITVPELMTLWQSLRQLRADDLLQILWHLHLDELDSLRISGPSLWSH